MNNRKAKNIRRIAKAQASTEKAYITKTTTTMNVDPITGTPLQTVKNQTRLIDNCAKALGKMIKQGKVVPECWTTEELLQNGYVA